ncbi:MAG: bifunctional metallophosphatase/5'-nucleotidase [Acidimicrobiales bacterium]|nr:bifunctional metallophosphatase/5'-nucleotidase [Acidimicrobiales bacterium]
MPRSRTLVRLAAPLVLAVAVAACRPGWPGGGGGGGGGGHHRPPPVEVQVLGINDFHGNLEPPAGSSGRIEGIDAGGAAYLASHVAALEATNPRNTVVVSAGDLVGASPLLSALFHDEPTVEAMNAIGLDINAVGNHEFDEGTDELLRLQEGGCHPVDGCLDGDGFAGADFEFLAANVVSEATGDPLFPAVSVQRFQAGTKVAFIGMTLEGTPTIVTPEGVAGYDFLDEADTANEVVRRLERQGIDNVIVLLHEGGVTTGGGYNGCEGIAGPIVDIVERLDDQVDAVISGHTHQAYNCVIDGVPVTSASSFGRLVTDMDLTIDRRTKEITSIAVDNVIVTRDVEASGPITDLIGRYDALSAPLANRVIGSITADILRAQNAAGESALGDVIADSQLAATTPPELGGAQAAFMNPGGIRADLSFAGSSYGEAPGEITYEEAFTVQPFNNFLVSMNLTGQQIDRMLEEQFCGGNAAAPRVLQPSAGFTYTYAATAVGAADCATADAVDAATIAIGGVPVDPAASYRITVNSFLATGGDNFPVLSEGTDRLGGAVDLDALEDYLTAAPGGVAPGPQDRITRIG